MRGFLKIRLLWKNRGSIQVGTPENYVNVPLNRPAEKSGRLSLVGGLLIPGISDCASPCAPAKAQGQGRRDKGRPRGGQQTGHGSCPLLQQCAKGLWGQGTNNVCYSISNPILKLSKLEFRKITCPR